MIARILDMFWEILAKISGHFEGVPPITPAEDTAGPLFE
jgi:hypothetical protein